MEQILEESLKAQLETDQRVAKMRKYLETDNFKYEELKADKAREHADDFMNDSENEDWLIENGMKEAK